MHRAHTLQTVAQKHFGRPRAQYNPKVLPGTFALLEKRGATTQVFLEEAVERSLARAAVERHHRASSAVKADAQAWNRHLPQELDDATAAQDHKAPSSLNYGSLALFS